jgi:hypothetical protein
MDLARQPACVVDRQQPPAVASGDGAQKVCAHHTIARLLEQGGPEGEDPHLEVGRAFLEVMVYRRRDEQRRACGQRVAAPADLVVATPADNQVQLEGGVPVTGVVVMVARVVPHDAARGRRNRLDLLE